MTRERRGKAEAEKAKKKKKSRGSGEKQGCVEEMKLEGKDSAVKRKGKQNKL